MLVIRTVRNWGKLPKALGLLFTRTRSVCTPRTPLSADIPHAGRRETRHPSHEGSSVSTPSPHRRPAKHAAPWPHQILSFAQGAEWPPRLDKDFRCSPQHRRQILGHPPHNRDTHTPLLSKKSILTSQSEPTPMENHRLRNLCRKLG